MTTYERADPNPKNLIHSLRDIGYSLETAIADIVDNSITALATNISIYANFSSDRSYIAMVDNGKGMDDDELTIAMQLGSLDPALEREKKDLGRFGLGLKTASFSQASLLTVLSRSSSGRVVARRWDLDHVSEVERWEVQVLSSEQIKTVPEMEQLPETGTVVVWEGLYRLIENSSKRSPEDIFWEKIDSARAHLSLVFHRYLKGEPGLKKISLSINKAPIDPFDPFEGAGTPFPEERFHNMSMQAYLLPHHSKTNKENYERLAGREGYLKSQGFYVYRNARLLVSGTWFRIIAQKEATKLARVKIDLPNSADFKWSIDVKKSQATPPEEVRAELKRTIERITSQATRVYTNRGKKVSNIGVVSVWSEFHKNGDKSYKINVENPLIKSFIRKLDDKQTKMLSWVFELIENGLPIDTIYADMLVEPEKIKQQEVDFEGLNKFADSYWSMMKEAGVNDSLIFERMVKNEPFSKYPEFCKKYAEEVKGRISG